jgi:hypothetical protein
VSDVELPSYGADTTLPGDGIDGGCWRRTGPLVGLTARTAGEAVVTRMRGKVTGADSSEFHIRTAERYAELLGRTKGALMKAGQMLSFVSAGPAVPAEFQSIYQTALARLRDDAPPMAPQLVRDVLERELGRTTESVFAQFHWEPLAAASIGQVHPARLHDGREVAVKIQYPGVADAIRADLKNAELLAAFVGLVFGGLSPRRLSFDLRGIARELSVRISQTPEHVARRIERRCSPNGPSANAVRHNIVSPDYTVMARIEIGVASVIAQLRAGNHWGAIAAEHLEKAEPLTEMGKRERVFFEGCQVVGNA